MFSPEDDKAILVWRFAHAPPVYKSFSTHGGGEDWLCYVPSSLCHESIWWMQASGYGYFTEDFLSRHSLTDGAQVRISAHWCRKHAPGHRLDSSENQSTLVLTAAQKRRMIRVWNFKDAPAELQKLYEHGGHPEFLAHVPAALADDFIPWMQEFGRPFGYRSVREYRLSDGSVVRVGALWPDQWTEEEEQHRRANLGSVTIVPDHFRKTIIVWRFADAPADFKALSTHDGAEEWLVYLPPALSGWIAWAELGPGFEYYSSITLADGAEIRIGARNTPYVFDDDNDTQGTTDSAATPPPIKNRSLQPAELARAVFVWSYYDAPQVYRHLSPHGGDEDWLAWIPPALAEEDYPWMASGSFFGCCDVSEHELADGALVRIGAHA